MENSQKPEFIKLLTGALASYAKPLPTGDLLAAWWTNLQPFPIRAVEIAFESYLVDNGEFPPLPAGIAKRCKQMDGRPNAEEAWAIALTSQDEANTVVWTTETASAFSICQSVLDMGDEVGARMAFKEAYARIVTEARSEHLPAQWVASLGWNVERRTAVLQNASRVGLLGAPIVAALLPAPDGPVADDASARAQIAKIKEMMTVQNEERARQAEDWAQRERDATAEAKRRTAEMAANYLDSQS